MTARALSLPGIDTAAGRLPTSRIQVANSPEQVKKAVALLGQGIKAGADYYPIRAHASGVATRAPAKDYLGQVREIYNDITRNRWRYVKEYGEQIPITGRAIWTQVLGAGARPGEKGWGDCDCVVTAGGSMLASIGALPLQIVTTNAPASPKLFDHVYLRTMIPRMGWLNFDPVLYPDKPLGHQNPVSRIAYWDLDGNLLAAAGALPRGFESHFSGQEPAKKKGAIMQPQEQFTDYGLYEYGFAGTDEPLDWSVYGLKDFGAYSPMMGMISDGGGLLADVTNSDIDAYTMEGEPLVRTKMFEINPVDYERIINTGMPKAGAVALAADGDVYQWQYTPEGLGFFKKLFRKVGKAVKKVAKKVKGVAKKLISKLPGGKFLVKMFGKLHKIAMKMVKPLMKFVGPLAKKLAPIAAFIPGYGPAIAGALKLTGKIADIAKKVGVDFDKTGKPKFKSGKQAKKFKKTLEREAERAKRGKLAEKVFKKGKGRGRRRKGRRRGRLGGMEPLEQIAVMRGLGADIYYDRAA